MTTLTQEQEQKINTLSTKDFKERMPKSIREEITLATKIWNNGYYHSVTLTDGYVVISKSYKEAKRHIQRHLEENK